MSNAENRIPTYSLFSTNLTKNEIIRLDKRFSELDKDGSGSLEMVEDFEDPRALREPVGKTIMSDFLWT